MHRAAQAYLQTQVTTTGQGDVVILLFDGAVNFLNRAKESIEVKDYAAKGVLISKALDVINELQSTLNMEKGGELARNLYNLYVLCSSKLLTASMRLDIKLIDEVIAILTGIRNAFAEILTTPEAQTAAQEIALKQKAAQPAARAPMPIPETQHGAFASNARVRGLYAQKTAEFGTRQPAEAQPAVQSEARPEAPQAAVSASPAPQPAGNAPGNPASPEKTETETKETAEDKALPPPSFGGSKMPNMDLYRKFSASGGI